MDTGASLYGTTFFSRPQLFEAIAEKLSGSGVEFGAGANPFPIGAHCRIRYADSNSNEQLRQRDYFPQGKLVEPDLKSSFETMDGLALESLDFIIASHVIEHTANPLRALQSAFERLRSGGKLVLIVPDKTATFDRDRPPTTLEHLLADYTRPSRDRDWEHYIEFFAKSFPQADPIKAAQGPFEEGHDIHFHVWTYEGFGDLIQYVCQKLQPWASVWSHPRLSDDDIEFYFILTK